jgi:hypothetical protein
MGNVLPGSVVNALAVGLYGMFIAIFVPPAKSSRVVRRLVLLSMALSFAASRLDALKAMSSGIKTIALTVALSAAAALFAPIREAKDA